jgi:hypothetical protein
MFTLDGRMRFDLALQSADEANFNEKKLREIVLSCRADGIYELSFLFDDEQDKKASELLGLTTQNFLNMSWSRRPHEFK